MIFTLQTEFTIIIKSIIFTFFKIVLVICIFPNNIDLFLTSINTVIKFLELVIVVFIIVFNEVGVSFTAGGSAEHGIVGVETRFLL